MAERRMFAKTIIDSDIFLDMPLSTQALYFHLSMRADDDGFINNSKKIQRMIGCGDDDLKLLIAKKFLIPFESGVVVIKHWRIHNYIQNDRYTETNYKFEKSMLNIDENKSYTFEETGRKLIKNKIVNVKNELSPNCIHDGNNAYTQDRIGKDRIGKDRIGKDRIGKDKLEEINVDSCSSLEKNLDIFKHFEKCGFIVTVMLMEQIAADIEIYNKQWLMDAATEAMNRGKINNYKYVLGILQNWTSNGRKEVNSDGSIRPNIEASEEESRYNFNCY